MAPGGGGGTSKCWGWGGGLLYRDDGRGCELIRVIHGEQSVTRIIFAASKCDTYKTLVAD